MQARAIGVLALSAVLGLATASACELTGNSGAQGIRGVAPSEYGFSSSAVSHSPSRFTRKLSPEQRAKLAENGQADKAEVRKSIQKHLRKAQKFNSVERFEKALASIDKARKIDELSAFEQYAIAITEARAATGAGQSLRAAKAYEQVLDSAYLDVESQVRISGAVAGTYFKAGQYKKSAKYGQIYRNAGGRDGASLLIEPMSKYQLGEYEAAASVAEKAIQLIEARGDKPKRDLITVWSNSMAQLQNREGHARAMQAMARHYPGTAT